MGAYKKSRRRSRKVVADCRRGEHRFGSPKPIGGGITRQTCLACRAVSIDLTGATPAIDPTAVSLQPHAHEQ